MLLLATLERNDQSQISLLPSSAAASNEVELDLDNLPENRNTSSRPTLKQGFKTRKAEQPSRRVAFDSIVSDSTGGVRPLRCDSHTSAPRMDSPWQYRAPYGHKLIESLFGGTRGLSLHTNRILVLILTFLSYAAYHASRKPPSIVKSVLHGSASADESEYHQAVAHRGQYLIFNETNHGSLGWAPFNDPKDGKALLGDLDLAFLAFYAAGMFVSGHLGDRLDLRHFLTIGMLGSGTMVIGFGVAYFLEIHSLAYFIVIQALGGLFQATGWPSVVSVMANWFGKGKRGLIMGIWNAHTSIGNIAGSLIAAYMLRYGWGWSFIVPGAVIIFIGILVHALLVVEPQDIGFLPQSGSVIGSMAPSEVGTPGSVRSDMSDISVDTRDMLEQRLSRLAQSNSALIPARVSAILAEHHSVHPPHGRHGLLSMGSTLVLMDDGIRGTSIDGGSPRSIGTWDTSRTQKSGVSFMAAWAIPGVAVYAFTLFFAKLVAYTFLYWLPYYINATEVGGKTLTPEQAGNLSILFDVGGVVGGTLAGYLSDASGSSALVSTVFVYSAIPFLYAYRAFGSVSFPINISLMMAAGFFVNGPYALITTAVSADLGTHSSLAGNEKALATVTAIIDGMGSIGAAIGPVATGYISQLPGGFDNVFYMLYGAASCAGLLLTRLVIRELKDLWKRWRGYRQTDPDGTLAGDDVMDSGQFQFLPPGTQRERTVDNETGLLV